MTETNIDGLSWPGRTGEVEERSRTCRLEDLQPCEVAASRCRRHHGPANERSACLLAWIHDFHGAHARLLERFLLRMSPCCPLVLAHAIAPTLVLRADGSPSSKRHITRSHGWTRLLIKFGGEEGAFFRIGKKTGRRSFPDVEEAEERSDFQPFIQR